MSSRTVPSLAHAHRLHRAGQEREAEATYRRILRAHPAHGDAHQGLSVLAYGRGDDATALRHAQAAVQANGQMPACHLHLGHVLKRLRRNTEAVGAYLRAAELDQANFDALFHLGALLTELQRPREAANTLRLAAGLVPEHAGVHLYLGHCLERLGQIDDAVERYLTVLRLEPRNARAYLLLGGALVKAGHAAEADLAFQKSLELDPHQPTTRSRRIAALNYRSDLTARQVADAHKEWDRWHGAPLFPARPPAARRRDEERLRVGYVSPNFYRHSVAHFLLPTLRCHDRSAFEVFLYAENAIDDATTQALRAAADHWRPIHGERSEDVAALVRADKIDILVDLAGHTGDNRLLVFARKPAPVQVSWLGYPQTSGMRAMDYRLSDAVTEPSGDADELSAEAIVRLPHGFHCFGRPGEGQPGDGCGGQTLEIGPLPAAANGFVTFGSFNTVQKMPPNLVRAWALILKETPGARLLLKSYPDDVIGQRFRTLFETEGVDPERVEFLHMTDSRFEHLRLYNRMDIALDPYPYNGTTTTCEALWMGVPVVTLCGDRHVARVGASLLTRMGLEDWITHDEETYIAEAVRRAGDPAGLAELRGTLRERMRRSPLCDAEGFARDIEAAFHEMWRAKQA